MSTSLRSSRFLKHGALMLTLMVGLAACTTPGGDRPGNTQNQLSAPSGLSATLIEGGVKLSWTKGAGGAVAGYRVFRAASLQSPFVLLTPQLLTAPGYSDTGAPAGATSYYRVVAVDSGGKTSAAATITATRPAAGLAPKLVTENLDGVPFSNRLVFSRIGSLSAPPSNGVHDTATVRLKNSGTAPLRISGLSVGGPWKVEGSQGPAEVAAGEFLDVRVRFVASPPLNTAPTVYDGTLTVSSNDPAMPSSAVQLAGIWQSGSETYSGGYSEPTLEQIRSVFGYKLALSSPGEGPPPAYNDNGGNVAINQHGLVRAQGDEVLSAYWQRADDTQPVSVQVIASWSSLKTARLAWYTKGSGTINTFLTRPGNEAQTLLPHLDGSSTQQALASFAPANALPFGFVIQDSDNNTEFSDPVKNRQDFDISHSCPHPCGSHLRFWALRDQNGAPVPNSYFVGLDYLGLNYDYQDNVLLIRNIRPANLLYDVGIGTNPYVDSASGNVWLPDRDQNGDTLYSPSTAIDEPAQPYTGPIGGATDAPAQIYRTYRGNVGSATPQDQRTLSFNIPLNNGTYGLRLHFADLAHDAAGQRVFDVSVNGSLRIAKLDIAGRVGGKTALVIPLDNVVVSNGTLRIDLKASVDFPSIAAIEVLR